MKNANLLQSFKNAIDGLKSTFIQERNFKIHVLAFFLVVCASIYFKLDGLSFGLVIITAGAVLATELINTAIEALVDLYCGETFNHYAKIAKDAAAAAVLVSSAIAVIIGLVVFGDKVFELLQRGVQ